MTTVIFDNYSTNSKNNSTPWIQKNKLIGETLHLNKIRDDFSEMIKFERKNGLYNNDLKNWYQFNLVTKRLEGIYDGFEESEQMFENKGLSLTKILDRELKEPDKYNVEYIKIRVYQHEDKNIYLGGYKDGLSISLGYLPGTNEVTLTEVKYKK